MKKKKLSKFFMIFSIILVIVFFIKTIINYFQYLSSFTSAPFYICIIVNAIFIIIPAIILIIIGIILNK